MYVESAGNNTASWHTKQLQTNNPCSKSRTSGNRQNATVLDRANWLGPSPQAIGTADTAGSTPTHVVPHNTGVFCFLPIRGATAVSDLALRNHRQHTTILQASKSVFALETIEVTTAGVDELISTVWRQTLIWHVGAELLHVPPGRHRVIAAPIMV